MGKGESVPDDVRCAVYFLTVVSAIHVTAVLVGTTSQACVSHCEHAQMVKLCSLSKKL